jgi:dihydroflavonol-4-reductase
MKPTLVTGANGHVGNNLCRALVARGERVRAMMRRTADPAPLAGLDVEIVHGDILDPASCEHAVAGCERVYHAAAGFLMWSRNPERDIVEPSAAGTRHVLEAAAKAGVSKVLYVSTGGTIGFASTPGEHWDEGHQNTTPHTWYLKGKVVAERTAFDIARRTKMPVTAVNPGLILGPRFFKVSESVRQIVDFVNQPPPVYFDGGFGVVDVEDVVSGALLGMEKGRDCERYIVSGEDVTVLQAFTICAELIGVKPPSLRVPLPLLRLMAGGMELASKLTGKRPMLDRSMVDEFAGKWGYHSSAKAERELGYRYRSARETLRRTVAWAVDRGFVPEKRRAALQLAPELQHAY